MNPNERQREQSKSPEAQSRTLDSLVIEIDKQGFDEVWKRTENRGQVAQERFAGNIAVAINREIEDRASNIAELGETIISGLEEGVERYDDNRDRDLLGGIDEIETTIERIQENVEIDTFIATLNLTDAAEVGIDSPESAELNIENRIAELSEQGPDQLEARLDEIQEIISAMRSIELSQAHLKDLFILSRERELLMEELDYFTEGVLVDADEHLDSVLRDRGKHELEKVYTEPIHELTQDLQRAMYGENAEEWPEKVKARIERERIFSEGIIINAVPIDKGGINLSYFAEIFHPDLDKPIPVVVKPRQGEIDGSKGYWPGMGVRQGTGWIRARFASVMAGVLRADSVPATGIQYDQNLGEVSVQERVMDFVPASKLGPDWANTVTDRDALRAGAVLDYGMGQLDRHSGNVGVRYDGTPVLIDQDAALAPPGFKPDFAPERQERVREQFGSDRPMTGKDMRLDTITSFAIDATGGEPIPQDTLEGIKRLLQPEVFEHYRKFVRFIDPNNGDAIAAKGRDRYERMRDEGTIPLHEGEDFDEFFFETYKRRLEQKHKPLAAK